MTNSIKLRFSKGEELANAISHGLGLLFSIIALILLLIISFENENSWQIFSVTVFGLSMILLYFSSTMNHSLRHGKAKDFFHNFDQIAIYLLIAGTYTPIALSGIRENGGWIMFGIEWGLAISGLLVKAIIPNKFERGVNTLIILSYVIMGWLVLFFLKPLYANLPQLSMLLIFAGGFFYTVGIIFFKMKKLNFSHLIWHLFVVAGSFCHFLAIYIFIRA